jgi:hypothetical protein
MCPLKNHMLGILRITGTERENENDINELKLG